MSWEKRKEKRGSWGGESCCKNPRSTQDMLKNPGDNKQTNCSSIFHYRITNDWETRVVSLCRGDLTWTSLYIAILDVHKSHNCLVRETLHAVTVVCVCAYVCVLVQVERLVARSTESPSELKTTADKYCCVFLPDGTASLTPARPGMTIRHMLTGLCEKRGLPLSDIIIFLQGKDKVSPHLRLLLFTVLWLAPRFADSLVR